MQKPATTRVAIDATIAARWSGRAFDPARAVSREQTLALFEAARWAPSCYGAQPWRFICWNRLEDAARWQRAFDCLTPGNQLWVKNAPLLLLVVTDSLFRHNGEPNRWAQYDAGAAAENLCLQASHAGLMAHQMGGFDPERLRAAFDVPAQFVLMTMIAVGHPAAIDQLDDEARARELAPRQRHPLGELFFSGAWGNPAA